MTVLTIEIPDEMIAEVSKIVKKKGGHIVSSSKSDLSKIEQLSLNQSLKEAELIKSGAIKALSFDNLWNE